MVMPLFVGQYTEDSIHCKNGGRGEGGRRKTHTFKIYNFGTKI